MFSVKELDVNGKKLRLQKGDLKTLPWLYNTNPRWQEFGLTSNDPKIVAIGWSAKADTLKVKTTADIKLGCVACLQAGLVKAIKKGALTCTACVVSFFSFPSRVAFPRLVSER